MWSTGAQEVLQIASFEAVIVAWIKAGCVLKCDKSDPIRAVLNTSVYGLKVFVPSQDYPAVNKVYSEFFNEDVAPARAAYQVSHWTVCNKDNIPDSL